MSTPQIPTARASANPAPARRIFWRAYLDWLSKATVEDANELEDVLTEFAHHVRPLVHAVSDALNSPQHSPRLPQSLVLQLQLAGWQPTPQLHAQPAAA